MSEEEIIKEIMKIVSEKPLRALEIKKELSKRGIAISYKRLVEILNEMVERNKIKKKPFKCALVYYSENVKNTI